MQLWLPSVHGHSGVGIRRARTALSEGTDLRDQGLKDGAIQVMAKEKGNRKAHCLEHRQESASENSLMETGKVKYKIRKLKRSCTAFVKDTPTWRKSEASSCHTVMNL